MLVSFWKDPVEAETVPAEFARLCSLSARNSREGICHDHPLAAGNDGP
jgi:hypothetical protein